MIKIGVVWFDDIEMATEGWASQNGEDSYRIDGVGQLSSNTFWITNLSFKNFRRLNLNQFKNIFDEQYFRTSLRQLAAELGLSNAPS